MHVKSLPASAYASVKRPVKPWVKEVPLYGPGYDAKSLVALEMSSKATWRVFNINSQLCKEPFYGLFYEIH